MEQIKIEESEILDAYCEKRICKDLPNVNCTASSSNEYVKQELDNQYHSHDDASSLNPENEECDNKCVIKKLIDQKEIKVENEETECIIHNVEYLTKMDLVKKEKEELLFQEDMDETADHIIDGNKCLIRQYIPENSNQNCMIPSEDSHFDTIKPEPEKNDKSDVEENQICEDSSTLIIPEHNINMDELKWKIHKCSLCSYSSDRKDSLKMHIDRIHLKLRKHKCTLCDYCASEKTKVKLHMASVHLKVKKYKCPTCDYGSCRKRSFTRHVEGVHLGLKKNRCDMCDFSTSNKNSLKDHINCVHLNMRNHKCHVCDYSTSLQRNLKLHINSVHLGLKEHRCKICDYSSEQRSRLKRHIEVVHLLLKQPRCSFCNFHSYDKNKMDQHLANIHCNVAIPI